MKKILILGAFIFCSLWMNAQTDMLKALYVNDFVDIIDVKTRENELLAYAKDHEFNYLIIYNIHQIHRNRFPLDSEMTDDPFANFIRKAKTEYGILRISVVGEKAASFDPVLQYNLHHIDHPEELVDGFNLELEFWNTKLTSPEGYYSKTYLEPMGLPGTRAAAFYFYIEQLKTLRTIASEFNLKLESYVGNVTKEEMQELIQYINTIHVHYYRKDLKKIAQYKSNRLEAIIDGKSKVEVFPIFGSGEEFMKEWLKTNSIDSVFPAFMEMIEADAKLAPVKQNIKGQTWYRYSDMPK